MEEIRIMEKPDWISWDDIQECQIKGHSVNMANGIDMLCTHLTGEEIKQRVGGGKCFVAIHNGRVVGTASYNYNKISQKWCRGNVAYMCFDAVLPEYAGKKIYSRLWDIRMDYIKKDSNQIDCIWMTTHENNLKIQSIYQKYGFRYIQLKTSPLTDYYSVIMAIWPTGKEPNVFLLRIRYLLYKVYVKLRYKPGHIKRFGV